MRRLHGRRRGRTRRLFRRVLFLGMVVVVLAAGIIVVIVLLV